MLNSDVKASRCTRVIENLDRNFPWPGRLQAKSQNVDWENFGENFLWPELLLAEARNLNKENMMRVLFGQSSS